MPITTLSSREFNQGTSEAMRTANNGPVFITDRGRPAHVLMSFEDFDILPFLKEGDSYGFTR